MGLVKLELRAPKSPSGIVSADPDPYWSLDTLISELDNLELKLRSSSPSPPLMGPMASYKQGRLEEDFRIRGHKPFIMCVSDDDLEDGGSDDEDSSDRNVITGTRFSAVELDLSDSEGSDDELDLRTQTRLMEKTSLAEAFLFELEREHQLIVKEEIRKKVSALEAELRNESEMSASAILRLEKYTEARREMDRRLDKQYQHKIAEALGNHLSVVQRDHEQRTQIEEWRIRNDAALEEAKRKEKALHEEKIHQEKAKAEAEARLKAARIAEETQKAALEAARKAASEGAEKEVSKTSNLAIAEVAQKEVMDQKRVVNEAIPRELKEGIPGSKENSSGGTGHVVLMGIKVRAVESALNAETQRLAIHKEVAEKNDKLILSSNKDFDSYERQIHKKIKQITGTIESVRAKAGDLINIINDPQCPHTISMMMFARKVVSICENPGASFDGTAFACGHVILLVTSRVPVVMDLVLAEFHKACIYTVPKYIQSSEKGIRRKGYLKSIGLREENGNIESLDSYLERMGSYMKLYGALIQTEISGIQNPHGLKEGWVWLARFLNGLPANVSTAVALDAFLQMAGFALFRRYKSQFIKILNIISHVFLPALKAQGDPKLGFVISKLELYLKNKKFLEEPEGRRLQNSLSSRELRP